MKAGPRSGPRRAPKKSPGKGVALVLGGGGLKGFAHIGVLRALAERGITPSVYAGTSIGALIAAAAAGAMPVDDMEERARDLKRTISSGSTGWESFSTGCAFPPSISRAR
jgi:Predicted esterase of the alpha-beta hydrolase superfamily